MHHNINRDGSNFCAFFWCRSAMFDYGFDGKRRDKCFHGIGNSNYRGNGNVGSFVAMALYRPARFIVMSQSNVIFAAIFIAYLIFITVRGEIPIYLGLLLRSPAQNPPGSATATAASGVNAGQAANAATATASLAGFY
jgi:hypothetical protein